MQGPLALLLYPQLLEVGLDLRRQFHCFLVQIGQLPNTCLAKPDPISLGVVPDHDAPVVEEVDQLLVQE